MCLVVLEVGPDTGAGMQATMFLRVVVKGLAGWEEGRWQWITNVIVLDVLLRTSA